MSAYDTSSFVLTDDQIPGVIALGTISTISTVCSSLLLLHLLVIAFASRRSRNHDERVFLRTHLGALVVCLFTSDLIQGLSGMVQLVWATNRKVTTGSWCMAQAVMLHIGDVGTAYWNAVIAIHTFWTVVLGKRTTTLGIASLIAAGWTLCFILTIIGPFAIQTEENGPFYAIAGAWCFITSKYQYPRIVLHYLPMLLSAGIITILYIHVALVLFGILTVDGGTWRLKAPTRKSGSGICDFFGQFSWSRLHRRPGPAANGLVDHPDPGSTGGSDGSLDRGRQDNRGVKKPTTPEMSVFDLQSSSRPLRLKMLGIKMLWYPSVYLVLILPMALSRIDPFLNIDLDVMLGFTCLLLSMGIGNTIIYLCTRRLGPAPWRRCDLSVSVPRSRSRSDRGNVGGTLSGGDISLQIQVEHFTKPAIDDQSIDLSHRKSTVTGFTELSSISTIPPVVFRDSRDDLLHGYKDGKLGFEFPGGKATSHVLRPSSAPHILSPSTPLMRQQEQIQDQPRLKPHPYSYSGSPARKSSPTLTGT